MIRSIGMDLADTGRFGDGEFREKILRRAFTPDETAYVLSRGCMLPQSAAGIFCAKEAFLKALGTGIGGLDMKEIEIGHTPSGQPFYRITAAAAAAMNRIGANRAFLSITHDGGMAAAFCVMSREEEDNAALPDK